MKLVDRDLRRTLLLFGIFDLCFGAELFLFPTPSGIAVISSFSPILGVLLMVKGAYILYLLVTNKNYRQVQKVFLFGFLLWCLISLASAMTILKPGSAVPYYGLTLYLFMAGLRFALLSAVPKAVI